MISKLIIFLIMTVPHFVVYAMAETEKDYLMNINGILLLASVIIVINFLEIGNND